MATKKDVLFLVLEVFFLKIRSFIKRKDEHMHKILKVV